VQVVRDQRRPALAQRRAAVVAGVEFERELFE
jgi:hypothetical protein